MSVDDELRKMIMAGVDRQAREVLERAYAHNLAMCSGGLETLEYLREENERLIAEWRQTFIDVELPKMIAELKAWTS